MLDTLLSHPGEVLKEEFLDDMGISVYALSKAIGVPRSRMNDIVLGRRGITADTAVRLGRFFGTDAQSWMNLQSHYDVALVERSMDLSGIRTSADLQETRVGN
ncbi:MAG: HigA family addiction module antitoxin [Bdellovibrionales bacterium]